MDQTNLGSIIMTKRKNLGLTQQILAEKLNISAQAISKWENGVGKPDTELLPQIARVLGTSIDSLFGYVTPHITKYEERYKSKDYYWGILPNNICYDILKILPPINAYKVLDIGCGEGRDAVFLAKNGYNVSAFDIAGSGLCKAQKLAEMNGVSVNFFKADIRDYRIEENYDIIYSSGVLHFVEERIRYELFENLKMHTNEGGINVLNVFVKKPFIDNPYFGLEEQQVEKWISGELYTYYHDWKFIRSDEVIFNCDSGGVAHKHCMNEMIAQK